MRKRLVWILAALAVAVAMLVARSRLRGPASPPPTTFRLANGLNVEIVPRDCGGNAALTVLFAVGTNHDPASHSGLVHVVQQLLVSGKGLIVQTSEDSLMVSISAPPATLLEGLDNVGSWLATPPSAEPEFASAKEAVLADIAKRSGADAELTATTDAAESVRPSAGQGRRGGVAAEVQSLDPATVAAFWRAHLTAGNARLVLVGDVDSEKARARIEHAFGRLPSGTPPVARPPRDMTVTGTLVMGDAPAAVSIAVRAPAQQDRVYPAFLVLAARLLMETPGPKEWAASYDPVLQPELLIVSGPLHSGEPAEPGAARIRSAMDALLARPLSPEDQKAARARFALYLGDVSDVAACAHDPRTLSVVMARREQTGIETRSMARAIDGLTSAQLAEALKFFAPGRTAAVAAGGVVR